MLNRIAAGLLLVTWVVAAQATPTASSTMAGPSSCRFEVPHAWPSTSGVKWEGRCAAGFAQGSGVLRAYGQGGQPVQVFYGRLDHGLLLSGVIERPDGYQAGVFKAGNLVETDDRSTIVKAFETASAAAREASERFAKQGNQASANHYAERARRLAEQMD